MINWMTFGMGLAGDSEQGVQEIHRFATKLITKNVLRATFREVDRKIARISTTGAPMTNALLPENSISIYKGASKTIELLIQDENKVALNLTGCRLILSIKRFDTDAYPILQKDTNNGAQGEIYEPLEGKVRFYFVPSDTLSLNPDQYVFDVWLIDADNDQYPVIPRSTFQIIRGVTILQ